MSAFIEASGEDLQVMSLSELTRVISLPVSRINKAVEQGIIRPCGTIGHCRIVALSEAGIDDLRAKLSEATPQC